MTTPWAQCVVCGRTRLLADSSPDDEALRDVLLFQREMTLDKVLKTMAHLERGTPPPDPDPPEETLLWGEEQLAQIAQWIDRLDEPCTGPPDRD